MATLGKWSGNTVLIIPTESWTAPNALFPTQDRNDGSAYSFTSSTSTLTLPSSGLADGYLMIGAYEFEDASNGRATLQGQIVQASGTGTFVGGPTSGYCRDNSEDRAYVRAWGFVDNPSASGTYQFQWKRDGDAPTNGTVRSEFQVIPLYYSNHGIYTSTSAALYGGTTPNQVTGWTSQDQSDTAAIEIVSNVVTVKGDNKRYLILGSQFFENYGASRTQRWAGLEIDGTKEDAAKAYWYSRNTTNDECGELYTWIIETVTANRTLESFCYRGDGVSAGQGGADVDGSTPTVGDHALVVLELNDSAEVFANIGNGGQALAATGPVDLTVCDTTDIQFNDAASFTRSTDTAMNAETAMDALLGANISAAQDTVSTGQRWTAFSEFTVNGTEQTDSFSGDYQRNAQTTQDTFGWSANLLGFVALALNDDVGVSVTELVGSEGGGGTVTSPDGWEGFWGVNLDTLESAAAPIDITVPVGAVALAGQIPTVDREENQFADPPKADALLTGQAQTLRFNVPVSVGSQLLAGQIPTLLISGSISIAPPQSDTVLTGYATAGEHKIWIRPPGYPSDPLTGGVPGMELKNVQQVYTGNIIAGDPSVRETGSGFEMFFTDADIDPVATQGLIAKATSTDGLTWTPATTPDPDPGIIQRGRVLAEALETSDIVKVGSTWYLYTSAYTVPGPVIDGFPADIYLLTSTDGINFTFHSQDPIIPRTLDWYNSDAIFSASVIYDTDLSKFLMCYTGYCFFDCANVPEGGGGFLMAATSTDGITWVEESEPIIRGNGDTDKPAWMDGHVKNAGLFKYEDVYYMIFQGDTVGGDTSLGFAWADDFTGPWTVAPDPILQPVPGTFYATQVQAASVIMDGTTMRIWFMGFDDPAITVGYAEADITKMR